MVNKFAERFKELREENHLSQSKISQILGYTQPAIAKWEKGLRCPNFDDLIKISQFFKVSTDYLLGLED